MTILSVSRRDRGLRSQATFARSFLEQAGGDPDLAERLRSQHFSEMGRRSGSRRRALAAERRAAEAAELEARAGLRITSTEELARLAGVRVER